MKTNNNSNILLVTVLIVIAVASRIFNAEFGTWNFACIAAMSLFSGSIIKQKSLAFLIPILAYFVSDLYLQITSGTGFYGISQLFVYGSMLLITALGSKLKQPKALNIFGFAISSSLIFFVLTNFGTWISNFALAPAARFYTTDMQGLSNCMIAGIPFYRATLLSDVVFSFVIFGSYYAVKSLSKTLKPSVN